MSHRSPLTRSLPLAALVALAAPATAALAQSHVDASHCEIFIDKITPYGGSHALRAAKAWVKIVPARLDGNVVEVGFRNAQEGRNANGPTSRGWGDDRLQPFAGASDYFELPLQFRSDFGANTIRGAFYVRTDLGTTYWAKSPAGDFTFDSLTYDVVMNVKGATSNYDSGIGAAVPTQRAGMEYYNPSRCL